MTDHSNYELLINVDAVDGRRVAITMAYYKVSIIGYGIIIIYDDRVGDKLKNQFILVRIYVDRLSFYRHVICSFVVWILKEIL